MPPRDKLYLWERKALFLSEEMDVGFHAHHGTSVAISTGEDFKIATEDEEHDLNAVIVGPSVSHRTLSKTRLATLMIDPDPAGLGQIRSLLGAKGLMRISPDKVAGFRAEIIALFDDDRNLSRMTRFTDDIYATVFGTAAAPKPMDARIAVLVADLKNNLPKRIEIKALAQKARLSADRLIRLFKEEMGLPLRRYLLWLKILEAVKRLETLGQLTDSAYAGGFSDSAHLSRIFKENIGFPPSYFFGENRKVDLYYCEKW